jgi:hypothetical protein
MQSSAKTVTAERKAALKQLRDLCRTILTDFEETMDYGGPSYKRNGEVVALLIPVKPAKNSDKA